MNKIENKKPLPFIGNRTYGLVRAAFFGFLTYKIGRHGLGNNNAVSISNMVLGSLATLEGLADVVMNENHYVGRKIRKYFENRKQENAS